MESSCGDWESNQSWWDNFDYPMETRRGQDHIEHALCAGVLRVPISPESSIVRLKVSLQDSLTPSAPDIITDSSGDVVADRLSDACRQFLVKRSHGKGGPTSVIAGYPWFADWGRDSLISLPGLLLKQDRLEEALSHAWRIRLENAKWNHSQSLRRCSGQGVLQHGRCQPVVRQRRIRSLSRTCRSLRHSRDVHTAHPGMQGDRSFLSKRQPSTEFESISMVF